jgi:hypothetical protein
MFSFRAEKLRNYDNACSKNNKLSNIGFPFFSRGHIAAMFQISSATQTVIESTTVAEPAIVCDDVMNG